MFCFGFFFLRKSRFLLLKIVTTLTTTLPTTTASTIITKFPSYRETFRVNRKTILFTILRYKKARVSPKVW